jgi:hypothetical protein
MNVDLAVMARDVTSTREDVKDIKTKLESNYATKEWVDSKYAQTKNIVSGILVTFGLAIVSAVAAFIIGGGLK